MRRRHFLGAAAGGLAATTIGAPAVAQSAAARTLRIVPQANLTSLDPVWTTATITRTHSYLVYDTILSVDENLAVKPQAADGWQIEDDGRTYVFTLREGQKFHNGEPVRAQDCVASIKRWWARDGFGQEIAKRLDSIEALDDRRFRIKLQRPFSHLLAAIAKPNASPCFIMPESVAATDPNTQINSWVGSGPYRFMRDEWVPGSRAVYMKYDAYAPRQEEPSWTAGGKVANIERMEWHIISDPATAGNALQNGEVDFIELPLHDLLPLFRRNRNIVVENRDTLGTIGMMRLNHLHPPFDNPEIRRALLMAINQEDFLRAVVGDDPSMYKTSYSYWSLGGPMHTEAGSDAMKVRSIDRAREALRAAGYTNQRIVQLHASDFPTIGAQSQVTADLMRRLGLNHEFVATDWGTVVQRRASREPVERGGWSIFHTTWAGPDWFDPPAAVGMRAVGTGPGGWFGWPTSEKMEALRTEWFEAPNLAEQQRLAREIQVEAFQVVPHVPLGHFLSPSAWRRNVSGVIKSPVVLFYNMGKGGA
jgi:peptide/nickel transport system substrate-binding protein